MRSVTVASTTDSQEAVQAAADLHSGVEPEAVEETEEVQPKETPAAGTQPGSKSESASAADNEDEDEGQGPTNQARPQQGQRQQTQKSRGDWQKSVDRLTRKSYRLTEENQRLKDELETLRNSSRQPEQQEVKSPVTAKPADGRPDPADAKYSKEGGYALYQEDLMDWKVDQRLKTRDQQQAADAEQERARQVADNYNSAAINARVKYDDFDQIVGSKTLKIPQVAVNAIFEAGELGPEIAYYLGKNPEVCAELAEMSPMRAVAKIGQIEMQLSYSAPPQRPAAVTQKPSSQKQQQRPTPPAPITPVGGSSHRSTVDPGELSYSEYKRQRESGAIR